MLCVWFLEDGAGSLFVLLPFFFFFLLLLCEVTVCVSCGNSFEETIAPPIPLDEPEVIEEISPAEIVGATKASIFCCTKLDCGIDSTGVGETEFVGIEKGRLFGDNVIDEELVVEALDVSGFATATDPLFSEVLVAVVEVELFFFAVVAALEETAFLAVRSSVLEVVVFCAVFFVVVVETAVF